MWKMWKTRKVCLSGKCVFSMEEYLEEFISMEEYLEEFAVLVCRHSTYKY